MEESEITKHFYLIYHTLLTNKNESEFVLGLNKIMYEHNISLFVNVKNVKALIFNLSNENLLFSYKMCMLMYIKSDLYCKIDYFLNTGIRHFSDKKFCVSALPIPTSEETEKQNNIDALEKIIISLKKLKEHMVFINAFNVFPSKLKCSDNDGLGKLEECKIINKEPWYNETKIEMINRLQQIVKYFGSRIYKIFGIKKKSNQKIMELSYKKMCNYYNRTITKIKKGIKKYVQLCEVYLEIEKAYVTSMITSDPNMDLDDFDLIIEHDNSSDSNNDSASVSSTEEK